MTMLIILFTSRALWQVQAYITIYVIFLEFCLFSQLESVVTGDGEKGGDMQKSQAKLELETLWLLHVLSPTYRKKHS